MKKVILITYSLLLLFIATGCTANEPVGEQNIKSFLTELYQVENTDEYQKLIEKAEEELKNEGSYQERTLDIAELFEPFCLKYENYCSETVLQNLIQNRHITRYDQQAWKEKCQFYVKEIELKQDEKKTYYYYTIQIEKRLNDDTTQLKVGKGIVKLNEEGLVDWFKITAELKDS
ncbi:MAG TPA: hypothetical protein DD738_11760 [Ruminiclostridium sp.]|jgi:hypothetical protein|nr:hypothetical protein [Ruminiclostridium sp.]